LEIFANNNLKIYLDVNVFPLFLRLTVVYFLSCAGRFLRHWTDVTRGVSGAGTGRQAVENMRHGAGWSIFQRESRKRKSNLVEFLYIYIV
jgi:hypothetical protein